MVHTDLELKCSGCDQVFLWGIKERGSFAGGAEGDDAPDMGQRQVLGPGARGATASAASASCQGPGERVARVRLSIVSPTIVSCALATRCNSAGYFLHHSAFCTWAVVDTMLDQSLTGT